MSTIVLENANTTINIPLSMIIADKKLNSRTVMDEDTIDGLAKTIKAEGQMTPVRVEKREDGKFSLIYGYRRFAAIKKLAADKPEEWGTIRAEVSEPLDVVQRKLANIAENMAREDLTPFDQAVAFLDLNKTHDMTGIKIANSVGKSVSYVNNLMRVIEGIDDSIIRRWEQECQPNFGRDKEGKKLPNVHKVCTMDWLTSLVKKTPKAEQEHELRVALGLEQDDKEETGEKGEGREAGGEVNAPKRATMKNLNAAMEAAELAKKEAKSATDKAFAENVIHVLKFAIGKTKSIKGIYTTPTPTETE